MWFGEPHPFPETYQAERVGTTKLQTVIVHNMYHTVPERNGGPN